MFLCSPGSSVNTATAQGFATGANLAHEGVHRQQVRSPARREPSPPSTLQTH